MLGENTPYYTPLSAAQAAQMASLAREYDKQRSFHTNEIFGWIRIAAREGKTSYEHPIYKDQRERLQSRFDDLIFQLKKTFKHDGYKVEHKIDAEPNNSSVYSHLKITWGSDK